MQLRSSSPSPSRDVLVVGEAVIDIVQRAEASPEEAPQELIGGGPTNTAVGLARLGIDVALLTWIGDDARGRRITAALGQERVRVIPESVGATTTPTATATIEADGSATYSFALTWQVPELALTALAPAALVPGALTPAPPALVHAGSIGLFVEPGGSRVLDLLRRHHGTSLITVDPNIRASLLPPHPVALKRFEDAVACATLVKLSDEDAAWLYPGLSARAAIERMCSLGPETCVLTRGADGAIARHGGEWVSQDPYRVAVADTISAGDSCMAALIEGLVQHGAGAPLGTFTRTLDRAARAAAIAVSRPGAAPPTAAELTAFSLRHFAT